VVGALFGSYMTSWTSYRLTCDIFALYCLGFGVLYFLVTQGWTALKELKEPKGMLDGSDNIELLDQRSN